MPLSFVPTIGIYRTNSLLAPKSFVDVTPADALVRPGGMGNCMLFILGHMAISRCGVAKLMESPIEKPWEKIFDRGAAPLDNSAYPPLAEVLVAWDDIGARIVTRMEALTDAELARPTSGSWPNQENTVRGALTFLALHDSYHVGQLAYARRLLGKSQLVG